jgi:trans-2,3-dihydro-3-hydroxyanthranilate isomerase
MLFMQQGEVLMEYFSFYILDVFAAEKYSGNQLAVVRAGEGMSGAMMQRVAREFNYSETTFVLSDKERNGGYDVRIFTPASEVPFAGHPVLGTAYVINREYMGGRADTVKLNLKAGQIPVRLHYKGGEPERLVMKQNEPLFGRTFKTDAAAGVLDIDESEIDDRFPVQEVSTGLPFVIVPIRRLEAMKSIKINREGYFKFIEDTDAKAFLVFCPETYGEENHFNVRMFAELYGIPEDPATGSGNGCLAGYLLKHGYSGGGKVDVRVEQGYEIGRPSLLYLEAFDEGGKIRIHVGGGVIPTARGTLL